ncbi:MAG: S-adenosylmethionine:tRNA ribosyltransferase-isomerase, partial [Deltaproteobacteria bacterium]|nr:S-adenosylmethionine:tRNA ribosyltransferase-isomerase [Deltaproteobacteria bacterium]
MRLKDFDYGLPEGLIAQYPLEERDSSRLLALERATGVITHGRFIDIKRHLRAGDVVVLNDTKVMPSRLLGRKETGGKAELLVIERLPDKGGSLWRCMARPSKGLKKGA